MRDAPGMTQSVRSPGEFIDVGSRRVHYYRWGEGTPAVVFESGLISPGLYGSRSRKPSRPRRRSSRTTGRGMGEATQATAHEPPSGWPAS